jgi:hypothetical protein
MTMALFRKFPDTRSQEGRISYTDHLLEGDFIAALACIRFDVSPPDQLGASCSLRNEAKFQRP